MKEKKFRTHSPSKRNCAHNKGFRLGLLGYRIAFLAADASPDTGSSKDGVIAKIDLKFSEESVSEP
jgi:hypothetical protein